MQAERVLQSLGYQGLAGDRAERVGFEPTVAFRPRQFSRLKP